MISKTNQHNFIKVGQDKGRDIWIPRVGPINPAEYPEGPCMVCKEPLRRRKGMFVKYHKECRRKRYAGSNSEQIEISLRDGFLLK